MDWTYINGGFVHASEAKISIFDRGFLFADSLYEVVAVIGGKLLDFEGHYARLERSCEALNIKHGLTASALRELFIQLAQRNELAEGLIYMQVTGGAAQARSFVMDRSLTPNIVIFTQTKNILDDPKALSGLKVMTLKDTRWKRRDIKTTQLLSQSMAKTAAIEAGLDDAWMVEHGKINEGSSNNAFIVTNEGHIVTRRPSHKILNGITRKAVIACAKTHGLTFKERRFTVKEAMGAREAFVTSASALVLPVVEIDGVKIGTGKVGPVSQTLRALYLEYVMN